MTKIGLTSVIIIHGAVASSSPVGLQQLNRISLSVVHDSPLSIRFHSGRKTSKFHAVHCHKKISSIIVSNGIAGACKHTTKPSVFCTVVFTTHPCSAS